MLSGVRITHSNFVSHLMTLKFDMKWRNAKLEYFNQKKVSAVFSLTFHLGTSLHVKWDLL